MMLPMLSIDDGAMTGAWDMNSGIITNLNIDSGTIDGITGTSNITDVIISGLTASKIVETNGSKQLVSNALAVSDLVPYTGATGDVDLGVHDLDLTNLRMTGTLEVNGTQIIYLPDQTDFDGTLVIGEPPG